jgi:glutamate carboxypeptidase
MAELPAEIVPQLEWLRSRQSAMVELVLELCNLNSGTLNVEGIARVRDVLCREYKALGGELKCLDVPPLERVNDAGQVEKAPLGQAIVITKRPELRPRLLLCIHMDTVYDLDHPFQQCQFLDSGRLNGPGVADAKGGLVVMLNALLAFEQSPLAERVGWQVIINPDEELGSPGSCDLLHDAAVAADWGLLFEPTLPDGTLVSWRKGSGNFTFVVRGKAVHAGRDFTAGRNAVVAMSRLMTEIHALNTDPEITYNVGRVSGGGALNIVPDLAIGRVNVRVRTTAQQELVEREFRRLVDVANQADGIRVELEGSFTSPPKTLDQRTESLQRLIEQCGGSLGIPIKWQGSGGASDGNKFAAAGLPNIDSLGPMGGEIHSSREYLLVDSLVPRTQLVTAVLAQLALQAASR